MEADERQWIKSRESKYWWLYENEIEEGLNVEGEREVMAEKGNMVDGKPDYWLGLRLWLKPVALPYRIVDSQFFSAVLSVTSTSLSIQKCPAPMTSTLVKRDAGSALSCSDQSRILFAEVKASWSP
jgi:hypothetical protein